MLRGRAPPPATQVFLEPRHQLDEIARPVPRSRAGGRGCRPRRPAGAGRAGQGEDVGAVGDDGQRPALHRRGADLGIAQPAEQLAEAGDFLFGDGADRFRRNVPSGDAGSAGGDDHVDAGVGDPGAQRRDDRVGVIADQLRSASR